jgi:precorrin-2 dehydrogenase
MRAALYPIALDLTGRPCLVIGGGGVAERKTRGLLDAGARVTVVSPAITDALGAWKADGTLRHVARGYCRGDLAGFQLAFVATGEAGVSAAVAAEGHERGIWVNAADDPETRLRLTFEATACE